MGLLGRHGHDAIIIRGLASFVGFLAALILARRLWLVRLFLFLAGLRLLLRILFLLIFLLLLLILFLPVGVLFVLLLLLLF